MEFEYKIRYAVVGVIFFLLVGVVLKLVISEAVAIFYFCVSIFLVAVYVYYMYIRKDTKKDTVSKMEVKP